MTTLASDNEFGSTGFSVETADWGGKTRHVRFAEEGLDIHQLDSDLERLAAVAGIDLDALTQQAARHFGSDIVAPSQATCSPSELDEIVNDELDA